MFVILSDIKKKNIWAEISWKTWKTTHNFHLNSVQSLSHLNSGRSSVFTQQSWECLRRNVEIQSLKLLKLMWIEMRKAFEGCDTVESIIYVSPQQWTSPQGNDFSECSRDCWHFAKKLSIFPLKSPLNSIWGGVCDTSKLSWLIFVPLLVSSRPLSGGGGIESQWRFSSVSISPRIFNFHFIANIGKVNIVHCQLILR